jgi:hypothetical protein
VASALAACLIWVVAAAGQAPVPVTHTSELSQPKIDVLADGRVAVTMDAAGDLAGSITLMLTPNGDGTFGGEWAMTVAHADISDPEPGDEPTTEEAHHEHPAGQEPEHEGPHRDFLRLVRRGALNGVVSSASVTFDANGVADVAANLAISNGAVEFANATGNGLATLSSLTLTF